MNVKIKRLEIGTRGDIMLLDSQKDFQNTFPKSQATKVPRSISLKMQNPLISSLTLKQILLVILFLLHLNFDNKMKS